MGPLTFQKFPALDPLKSVCISVPVPVNLTVISYDSPTLPHISLDKFVIHAPMPETPGVPLYLVEPQRIKAGSLQTRNFLDTWIKSWAQRKRHALVAEVWEQIRGVPGGLREGTPTKFFNRGEHQWAEEYRGQSRRS